MKKIVFCFLMFTSFLFAQEIQKKSLIDIKMQLSSEGNTINKNTFLQTQKSKKKAGLAVLYSLLLPGMGELYAGNYESGKYFTIADGVIWGFFTGFTLYGNRQEDNYKAFARAYGGVDTEGKSEKYFASISEFLNIDSYNRGKELNRQFDETFNVETHFWNWGDKATRREYRETWLSSEQAKNNIRFAVGALLINRVVSAINAVRLVSNYNKGIDEEISWNVSVGTMRQPTLPAGLTFNFHQKF